MTDIIEQPVAVRGTTRAKAPEPELSDTAIRGKDLDEEKANAAKAAAEEALKNAKTEFDVAKAQSEMYIIAAEIAALRKYRLKK